MLRLTRKLWLTTEMEDMVRQAPSIADDEPTGESLTVNWHSMSEREKDASLKAWNEEYSRRHPYVPPGGHSSWWDVGKLVLLLIAAFVGVALLRRQIAAFFTVQASLIVFGVSMLALHLLSRVEKCEREVKELRENLRNIERCDVQSSK